MLLLIVGESDFEDDMLLLSAGESDFKVTEADREGDVEGVQADREGDAEGGEANGEDDIERVQAVGQGDVEGVKANREGLTATQFEADEYNSGGFGSSVGDENVADFATPVGMDNVATAVSEEEEDSHEAEVYDSNKHGSLVGSDEDEEHENGGRRKSKFPLYKDRPDPLKFSLGMFFKDSKQFKSAIRNYFKEYRRQLKFLKNEPKRVAVKCIASPNCP
ncbi:hypothetical protein CXB51_014839 [Gossypium anomalum]|uniref:Transposase MuDR plant domain-containing protein n=1 Tax=Gossypium anomalum TaxID=47600 RepID=A0A8J5Z0E1_9ROSI|nr:hypothetical protein CXB51_014839 [Gossypium anomalum]